MFGQENKGANGGGESIYNMGEAVVNDAHLYPGLGGPSKSAANNAVVKK